MKRGSAGVVNFGNVSDKIDVSDFYRLLQKVDVASILANHVFHVFEEKNNLLPSPLDCFHPPPRYSLESDEASHPKRNEEITRKNV